jgi:hypothetical protein
MRNGSSLEQNGVSLIKAGQAVTMTVAWTQPQISGAILSPRANRVTIATGREPLKVSGENIRSFRYDQKTGQTTLELTGNSSFVIITGP